MTARSRTGARGRWPRGLGVGSATPSRALRASGEGRADRPLDLSGHRIRVADEKREVVLDLLVPGVQRIESAAKSLRRVIDRSELFRNGERVLLAPAEQALNRDNRSGKCAATVSLDAGALATAATGGARRPTDVCSSTAASTIRRSVSAIRSARLRSWYDLGI